ncbi:MAG: hypothetical protein KGJ66_07795 [Alphaproteobacteria bacterium]|nr:hypothetical protein [Alphaproteobacteria bacterium]
MHDKLFHGNAEPTIHDLVNDPIAQLLRQRDGIAVADVLAAVERARETLRHRRLTRACCTEAAA